MESKVHIILFMVGVQLIMTQAFPQPLFGLAAQQGLGPRPLGIQGGPARPGFGPAAPGILSPAIARPAIGGIGVARPGLPPVGIARPSFGGPGLARPIGGLVGPTGAVVPPIGRPLAIQQAG